MQTLSESSSELKLSAKTACCTAYLGRVQSLTDVINQYWAVFDATVQLVRICGKNAANKKFLIFLLLALYLCFIFYTSSESRYT